MTPEDLAMMCKHAIEARETGEIVVVLPRLARGSRMRLAGPGSPLGEVLSCVDSARTACAFDAIEVLAWLAANGLVQVEVVEVEG